MADSSWDLNVHTNVKNATAHTGCKNTVRESSPRMSSQGVGVRVDSRAVPGVERSSADQ